MRKQILFLLLIGLTISQENTGYIYIGSGPILAESKQNGNNSRFDLEKKLFYCAGLNNQISHYDFADLLWFGQVYYLNFEERHSGRTDTYTLYYLSLAPAIRFPLNDNFGLLAKFQYNFYITDSYSNSTSDPNHPFPSEQLSDFQSTSQLNFAIDYRWDKYKLELTAVPYVSDILGNQFNDIEFNTLFYLTIYFSI
ncbi:MAG: hypothetical protein KDD94_02950 [Calditrichaeota bacterium]|nr:hypothetical protein [Calditrichota bacterium]